MLQNVIKKEKSLIDSFILAKFLLQKAKVINVPHICKWYCNKKNIYTKQGCQTNLKLLVRHSPRSS